MEELVTQICSEELLHLLWNEMGSRTKVGENLIKKGDFCQI
ncbi:hypothetical protein Pf1_02130 [Flavobacterium columnare]|nr:hypothetical protein Pf1_02130 [Flavobacterium columnare]